MAKLFQFAVLCLTIFAAPLFATVTFDHYDVVADKPVGLRVKIETQNLELHSLSAAHFVRFSELARDKEVMAKYLDGQPWALDRVTRNFGMWTKRWLDGDPLSAFAVFLKSGKLIGFINIGYGTFETAPSAEGAGFGDAKEWGNHYGSEAFAALLYDYLPAIDNVTKLPVESRGRILGTGFLKERAAVPRYVTATASLDNPRSYGILDHCCFGPECADLAPCAELDDVSMEKVLAMGLDKTPANTRDKGAAKLYNVTVCDSKDKSIKRLRTCENRGGKVVKLHFVLDRFGKDHLQNVLNYQEGQLKVSKDEKKKEDKKDGGSEAAAAKVAAEPEEFSLDG